MSSASAPITQLLQQNSTDPRVRLQLGAQLIDLFAVQGYRVPSDVTLIQDLLDMLIVWLNSSNFKVRVANCWLSHNTFTRTVNRD
jgi:hypothetical protein